MSRIDTDATVGQLVSQNPGLARIFEDLGIDYCCGGKIPLAQAARNRGLDARAVAARLEAAVNQPAPDGANWAEAPLGELIDHILRTHHDYLRRELPRLTELTSKVAAVHGPNHSELAEVAGVFQALREELEQHMMKEEQILFPLIRRIEDGAAGGFHCGSVRNPIRVMEHEHDSAGIALARLRELTGGYTAPPDACNTYRVMLSTLAEVEKDLHQHIHLENNILFPRAAELETSAALV